MKDVKVETGFVCSVVRDIAHKAGVKVYSIEPTFHGVRIAFKSEPNARGLKDWSYGRHMVIQKDLGDTEWTYLVRPSKS